MTVSVAGLLAETLKRLGVPRAYGIIGTSILDFIDTLYEYRDSIDFVTTRHEQVAVAAADGEARVSGRPGVAVVHAGPGFLNGLIALGAAFRDRVPLLLVTGGVRRRLRGTWSWLEVDQEGISRHLSKHYAYIGSAREAPSVLEEALRKLYEPPPAPVVIEVAEDVWGERVELPRDYWDGLVEAVSRPHEKPSQDTVDEVLERLMEAERPVIMACGELVYSPWFSQDLLVELADRLDAAIVVSGNGRGACPEDHPRCLGRLGFGGGSLVADAAFEASDFVLVLGNEFDDIHTYAYTMLPEGDVVTASLDPFVEKRPPYYEHIRVDPAALLASLVEALRREGARRRREAWWRRIEEYRAKWRAVLEEALSRSYAGRVNPSRFFHLLDQRLPRSRVVAGGQGTHIVYVYDYVRIYEPRSFLAATSLGAMSYAFPAAMGAKLARPDREVVAVVGDGDFMMTVQDLETLKRENIALKTIVVNDDSYRVLYLRQRIQKQGRIYETLLTNPDFTLLAESFGIKAVRVSDDSEAKKAIDMLVEATEPIVVEIRIDRDDLPPMNLEYTLRMSQA